MVIISDDVRRDELTRPQLRSSSCCNNSEGPKAARVHCCPSQPALPMNRHVLSAPIRLLLLCALAVLLLPALCCAAHARDPDIAPEHL